MSSRLFIALAFAASISLVTGLSTPAQADEAPALSDKELDHSIGWLFPRSDEICSEGTGDFCASTCGEDHDVQITEVCTTYPGGQTQCECCCYYAY